MRIKWSRIIAETCSSLLGTAMLAIAIFAYQLHLDKNGTWGPNRIALAILGVFFLVLGITIFTSTSLGRLLNLPFFQRTRHYFNWIKAPYIWIMEPDRDISESKPPRGGTGWYAIGGALLVILVSIWYITSGRMGTWTPSTTYFDRLADAFMAGQLSLLEKPPAALATLANPYQYQNREGIGGYLWDTSYYMGNYYLYWGPVPGLIAMAAKLAKSTWVIEDQFLIIFSTAGMAIVLAALFYTLQRNYFPKIPGWLILGATLLGVLNTPVFWLVNRPSVYEASIATGQFFLLLGVFTAICGMESQRYKVLLLTITGFAWAAAIGSRIDLGFGIIWMTFLICFLLVIQSRKRQVPASTLMALVLPLILGGASLAWYNFARFGNILETGHQYQLTGGGLPADYRNIVSLSYVLPNLYNILARPFEIRWGEFPFLFTPNILSSMWPKILLFPRNVNYIFGEPIAGIFISMPTNWFLLIPLMIIPLRRFWNWLHNKPSSILSKFNASRFNWIAYMLTGAVFLNMGILSTFIFSTMRYEADLTPLLTILFFLCAGWMSISVLSHNRLWNVLLIVAGFSILISISISLLTNFQSGDLIFRNNNPKLYLDIARFFTGKWNLILIKN